MNKVIKFLLVTVGSILALTSCSFSDLFPTPTGTSSDVPTSGTVTPGGEFSITLTKLRLNEGETFSLEVNRGSHSSYAYSFKYSKEYLSFDESTNLFTAKAASGYTDFKVSAKENGTVFYEKTYKLAINLIAVESVRFKEDSYDYKTNNIYDIDFEILPIGASYSELKFEVSDDTKLEVNGTTIKTLADGESTLKLKLVDGEASFEDECLISSIYQPVTGIEFVGSTNVSQGFETTLGINILPIDASDKSYTLTSSNETAIGIKGQKVVGKVIGGTSEITINASGFSRTVTLTVVGISKSDRVEMEENYYNVDYSGSLGGSTTSLGKAKLLVIPIWFADSDGIIASSHKDDIRDDIVTCYTGATQSNGWRSVKGFYEDESNGALELDITISDWYNDPNPSTQYTGDFSTLNTYTLAAAASDYYFEHNTAGEVKTDYDYNHDGLLDGVLLIYAHPDRQAYNRKTGETIDSNFWAYCAHRPATRNASNPNISCFFWASYDFMYSESQATSRTGINFYNGHADAMGYYDSTTFSHEMGHMFGLTDYYDTAHQYNPAGSYTMQDNDTGGHDPFSLLALNWAKAYIPETSCTITLDDIYTENEVIILSPSWNAYNSPFDEYLILELYSPTGLNYHDQDIIDVPNVGVRVWHVDARLLKLVNPKSTDNIVFSTQQCPGYTVDTVNTNTSYDGTNESSFYFLDFADYNILQLIRKAGCDTYKPARSGYEFKANSLFYAGESFSMTAYQSQFPNATKLNNGLDLGWSFTVDAIDSVHLKAVISLTRL